MGWVFAAPFALLFAVFMLVPIIASFALSFTGFSIGNIQDFRSTPFVGLDNYTRLFEDAQFLKSLRNTAYFVVVGVPFTIALGLVLAVRSTRASASCVRSSASASTCPWSPASSPSR